MFKNILGDDNEEKIKQLQEELHELQEKKNQLEEKLEAEKSRRKDAVREKQEAQEKINELEDKIQGLKGELNAKTSKETTEQEESFSNITNLSYEEREIVLTTLLSYEGEPESALTIAVEESVTEEMREILGPSKTKLVEQVAPCVVFKDDYGLFFMALDAPALDDTFMTWDAEPQFELNWFEPVGEFGFALVRSDVCLYGEFNEHELTDYTSIITDVKNNHSKGGFSQGRFENRRDEQIESHIKKSRDLLTDVEKDVILVGEKSVLKELSDLATVTSTTDVTGEKKQHLSDAFDDFWSLQCYRF